MTSRKDGPAPSCSDDHRRHALDDQEAGGANPNDDVISTSLCAAQHLCSHVTWTRVRVAVPPHCAFTSGGRRVVGPVRR